jgi:hypothetical protein
MVEVSFIILYCGETYIFAVSPQDMGLTIFVLWIPLASAETYAKIKIKSI